MSSEIVNTLNIDDWGRIVVDCDTALELLLSGQDLNLVNIEDSPELQQFNAMCQHFDKSEEIINPVVTPEMSAQQYHAIRSQKWLFDTNDNDLWDHLLEKCENQEERDRFVYEFEEFASRGMLPVLSHLHLMIQKIDDAGIVRGVGRGSSVASFILFLMGVHFINPLLYNLDINEFLK